MMQEYKSLSKEFWGRHMWARGYFVASSGNITDEVIIKYIEEQGKETVDDDFKTDDE
jgi:putative transposase